MEAYVINIEQAAYKNENFRSVLFTANHCQLVVMSLKPGEDIGEKIHQLDQFVRCEAGDSKAVLDGVEHGTKQQTEMDEEHFDGKTSE